MASLHERYRPSTWAEVLGQPKVLATIRRLVDRGEIGGRAYFISGPSGAGKTTIARLLAREVAGSLAIEEVNARDVDLAFIRDMERTWQTAALAREGEPHGRAYLFNEVHLMRKDSISRLLTTLEPTDAIPPHCIVVFTTTADNQQTMFEDYADASPFLSRCLPLKLAQRGLADVFATRAKEIAEQEGLDGRPLEQYKRLVQEHRQNLRAVLQAIEAGSMLKGDEE